MLVPSDRWISTPRWECFTNDTKPHPYVWPMGIHIGRVSLYEACQSLDMLRKLRQQAGTSTGTPTDRSLCPHLRCWSDRQISTSIGTCTDYVFSGRTNDLPYRLLPKLWTRTKWSQADYNIAWPPMIEALSCLRCPVSRGYQTPPLGLFTNANDTHIPSRPVGTHIGRVSLVRGMPKPWHATAIGSKPNSTGKRPTDRSLWSHLRCSVRSGYNILVRHVYDRPTKHN